MRQKYWIKLWEKSGVSRDNNGDEYLTEDYSLDATSNFFSFICKLIKHKMSGKYVAINVDIML